MGLVVVDKPRGPTSHDVVRTVRRALGAKAAGHAGTLDPMATGVLVVAVDEATKLMPWLVAQDKEYEAVVALGVETDTLDADGRQTRRVDVSPEVLAALTSWPREGPGPILRAALDAESARSEQVPPAVSAIKTAGERAYARARRGEAVELAPRRIRIDRLELLGCSAEPPSLTIGVTGAKGLYVRALARDLAQRLGTVGHLSLLRRTRSGCFTLDEAVPPTLEPRTLASRIIPLARAACRVLPAAYLTVEGAEDARHGRRLAADRLSGPAGETCAWIDPSGALVAVGHADEEGRGQVLRGFSAAPSPAQP